MLDADAATRVADQVVPPHRHARLDADARADRGGQDLVLVGARLLLEPFPAGHGDHPGADAGLLQPQPRLEGQRHLRAGGDEHHVGSAGPRVDEHVGALADAGGPGVLGAVDDGQVLAGQGQAGGGATA